MLVIVYTAPVIVGWPLADYLRGRVISLLRTLMQAAPPLGALLCSHLLVGFGVTATIVALAFIIAIPGLIGIVHPALAHENTIEAPTEARRDGIQVGDRPGSLMIP